MLNRRHLIRRAGALPITGLPFAALPQPSPARLLVGFPAGGPVDIAARFIAPRLSARLGESFGIEDLPGDSGNIATARVVGAPPDGCTLLLCGVVNTINTTLFAGLPFRFDRDLVAVAGLYRVPLVVEVHPEFPARNLTDFIDAARRRPGEVKVGYAGKGTPQHIGIELFQSLAKVKFRLLPYLGSAPALQDLLAGNLDAMFDPMPSSIAHLRAGRLRPLAITGSQSLRMFPDLPLASALLPGYEAGSWFGISAPRQVPAARIKTLNAATNAALAEPTAIRSMEQMGATPMAGTAAAFAAFIAAETARHARTIAAAHITLEPASAR